MSENIFYRYTKMRNAFFKTYLHNPLTINIFKNNNYAFEWRIIES